ncbi:MAG: dienelactone hydrolase family protein [Verrucomicrobia bacterium]|nr:dienelactone hydrolase family protein [Verrucomicrobiota bacterium]MDE3100047.1 dienelactone hydrolase family protein [Verrucomicrobiota bacterium]
MTTSRIETRAVDYQDGNETMEGFLAQGGGVSGKRPGVLVVHQWLGITDVEQKRADMLARLGYVAFCADIYGKGVRPKTAQEASTLAGKYRNGERRALRSRARAALDTLKKMESVDANRVAAIGYCFGGTAVIELARSGADLKAVVSFHGGLDSPAPADGRNIKCKVLALAGADDPFQNAENLKAFEDEMRAAAVDWQLVFYGGAVHSFTDWQMDGKSLPGAQYNERADKRSWEAMKSLFAEIF